MNYDLLKSMGLDWLDITYFFIGVSALLIILIIIIIILMINLHMLTKKYKKFMTGKNAKNLEQDIIGLFEDNKFIKMASEKNKKDINILYRRLGSAFQKIGIVKYNAFSQMGGQMSFCLALLDENDKGFLMNSVHSSDGCYTYTKEIKNGKCKIDLSEEEKKALEIAIGKELED